MVRSKNLRFEEREKRDGDAAAFPTTHTPTKDSPHVSQILTTYITTPSTAPLTLSGYISPVLMLGRLNLLVRHLPRSATTSSTPSISTAAAAATSGGGRGRGLSYRRPFTTSTMTSPIMPPSTAKAINTAACLIIGDEVLGGKVRNNISSGVLTRKGLGQPLTV